MIPVILLKIGGSVLTDKAREATIKKHNMRIVAKQIASAKVSKLILVHGAGSFGHPQALRYLSDGFNAEGIWKTHAAVSLLNTAFIEELHSENVPALPIHPLDSVVTDQGRIRHFEPYALQLMLESGITPVLHGDVVMDRSDRFSILSGDQIIAYLARKIRPEKLGLGTDVEGVFYKGKKLSHLNAAEFENCLDEIAGSSNVDVTGGMLHKVSELVDIAKLGVRSQIFDATLDGNITKFLASSDDLGTIIEA